MTKITIVAALVLGLGACSKGKWEQAVSDLEGFRDQMCACKDKGDPAAQTSCGEDVKKKMDDWEKSMEDKFGKDKDEKPPEKLMERGDKAEKEFRECKKAVKKAGGAAKAKAAMAKMTEFADSMCKCTDGACAQKVNDDMTKWGAEQAKDEHDVVPDEADMKKMTEVGQHMAECMAKAMGAGGAAPAPAAP